MDNRTQEYLHINLLDACRHAGLFDQTIEDIVRKIRDINRRDPVTGSTCLHEACDNGRVEIVRLLLERKDLDPTILDNQGRTALSNAAYRAQDIDDPVLRLMLGDPRSPEVTHPVSRRSSPLFRAAQSHRFFSVCQLLAYGKVGETGLDECIQATVESGEVVMGEYLSNYRLAKDEFGLSLRGDLELGRIPSLTSHRGEIAAVVLKAQQKAGGKKMADSHMGLIYPYASLINRELTKHHTSQVSPLDAEVITKALQSHFPQIVEYCGSININEIRPRPVVVVPPPQAKGSDGGRYRDVTAAEVRGMFGSLKIYKLSLPDLRDVVSALGLRVGPNTSKSLIIEKLADHISKSETRKRPHPEEESDYEEEVLLRGGPGEKKK